MKWLCPVLLFSIILETSLFNQIDSEPISMWSTDTSLNNMTVIEERETNGLLPFGKEKQSSFSRWSRWSRCEGGNKTRRRRCLRRRICGDSLRVEIAKCENTERLKTLIESKSNKLLIIPQKRQLDAEEVQKRFRGFSPWSEWSNCSRRCVTVRKRQCIRGNICGHRTVRQSAYCYTEGTYCHMWIRSRMQRRKDPGDLTHRREISRMEMRQAKYFKRRLTDKDKFDSQKEYSIQRKSYRFGHAIRESMATPAPAIHPEDSRSGAARASAAMTASCGKLGRYRGSMAARRRNRMREMIKIIGGRPAPPGKWPWQVAVLNRYKEAFCGGTLVSLRWVVTAAHCVRRRLYVRLGEHDLLLKNRGEVEMRVTEAVVHPGYDPDTVVNDVAMLRLPFLARPDLGHGVACLPSPRQVLAPHTSCVILGWGKRRATDVHGTRVLHEAQVSTIQQGVCRRSYWQYAITDDMVCAGRGHRDSCAGDSGGPLLCKDRTTRYYLQGITSFGDGCGKRGKYGIYTRTSGYVIWIKSVMNNLYFD